MSQETVRERIIIFTRYPEAGQTKTRLIPAVGAEVAAQIQRQMSEHTLTQVRAFRAICEQRRDRFSVEVRFTGGSLGQVQAWLGDDILYQPQGGGDLGDRMANALQAAFGLGDHHVVIIGTDCPGINAQLLDQAFQKLHDHDLVLGPALDGGYYLIGLRPLFTALFPRELFTNILWGSSEVLEKTIAIAKKLNLSYDFLPKLPDVDRPEDLPILAQFGLQIPEIERDDQFGKLLNSEGLLIPEKSPETCGKTLENSSAKISIIIPVVNEAPAIATTLQAAQTGNNIEIIVVDGGSVDGTPEIAKSCGVSVLITAPGRAHQMNAGAAIATGEILLFLHGDTRLSAGFDTWVRQTLAHPGAIAGAFELQIESPHNQLRVIEKLVQWRSRLLQMPYGDQGIFVSKKIFDQIGGFPEMPIMEDFELIRRLKKLGKIAIAPRPVLTSARRWHKLGVLKTTLINQLIVIGYLLGISPEKLVHWYRKPANPEKK